MVSSVSGEIGGVLNTQANSQRVKSNEKSAKAQPTSRVEELKKQIESGTYQIDLGATAKKIAETLI